MRQADSRAARRRLAGALALAGIVGLFWAVRVVAPARLPILGTGDLRTYFYPMYQALFDRVARHELPLWNPYQLCGLPWLGGPAGGLFYPPHLLYAVLPTHVALAASGLLHLALIALSVALFMRRAGLGPAATFLAATVFTLRGSAVAWLGWPPLVESAAWLPLGCVGVLGLARERAVRPAALLALCTAASWLAGGAQVTVYVLYAWATLLPALLIGARATLRGWLTAGALFAAAIGLGTLAAAVQLLPAMEMAGQGTRAIRQLSVGLMFPFGSPGPPLLRQALGGDPASFGVLTLALAPAALLVPRQRALTGWALAVGGLAFAFALGPMTPLFETVLALPLGHSAPPGGVLHVPHGGGDHADQPGPHLRRPRDAHAVGHPALRHRHPPPPRRPRLRPPRRHARRPGRRPRRAGVHRGRGAQAPSATRPTPLPLRESARAAARLRRVRGRDRARARRRSSPG